MNTTLLLAILAGVLNANSNIKEIQGRHGWASLYGCAAFLTAIAVFFSALR